MNTPVVLLHTAALLLPPQVAPGSEVQATWNTVAMSSAPTEHHRAQEEEPAEVGEASAGLTTGGSACRAACWGAAALGCGVVGLACTGTSVITIGGATIPCAWAAIAACTANTVGASLCADHCQP